jgi:hypothetical protein
MGVDMIKAVLILFVFSFLFILLFYPFYISFCTDTKKITFTFLNFFSIDYSLNKNEITTSNPFKNLFNLKTRLLFSIVKSFKITYLNVNLDTGNYPLNGILYPFFFLLSFFLNKNFSVNFNGKNTIKIIVKNNLARLSWAIISSKTIN